MELWVKKICYDVMGGTKLKIGAVVPHLTRKGVKVKIVDGQYWGEHGLSNFWSWRIIRKDGSLGPKRSGYGWM